MMSGLAGELVGVWLAPICLMAFVALSAYLLLVAGEVSFGQQAFFAVGAYGAAWATVMWSWCLPLALAFGMVLGAAMGGLLGLLALPLGGLRFSLFTLAAAEALRAALGLVDLQRVDAVGEHIGPAGEEGFGGIRYWADRGWPHEALALSIAGVLVLAIWLVRRLLQGQTGRVWRSLGQDGELAQAMGVNVMWLKALVFAGAGGLAALGGGLYAHYNTYVEPRSFDVMLGIHGVCYAILGGLRTPWGALLGVVLDVGLLECSRVLGPYRMVVFGGMVAGMLVLRPQGLLGGWPSRAGDARAAA